MLMLTVELQSSETDCKRKKKKKARNISWDSLIGFNSSIISYFVELEKVRFFPQVNHIVFRSYMFLSVILVSYFYVVCIF
jgi:hypothetical protein